MPGIILIRYFFFNYEKRYILYSLKIFVMIQIKQWVKLGL